MLEGSKLVDNCLGVCPSINCELIKLGSTSILSAIVQSSFCSFPTWVNVLVPLVTLLPYVMCISFTCNIYHSHVYSSSSML